MVFKLQTEDNVKEFITEFKRACELAGGTFKEEIKGTVHDATCTLRNDAKIHITANAAEHTNVHEPIVEVEVDSPIRSGSAGHVGTRDVFTSATCSVVPSKSGHQLITCSTHSDKPHEYYQKTRIFFKYDNIQIVKSTAPLGLRNIPHVYTDIDITM